MGFHIGGDSGVRYLTLQIHYGDASVFSGKYTKNASCPDKNVINRCSLFFPFQSLQHKIWSFTWRPQGYPCHVTIKCAFVVDFNSLTR